MNERKSGALAGPSAAAVANSREGRGSVPFVSALVCPGSSFTGSLPALMEFLDIVRSTPGLQEILLEVLDKPSVIDVFRHGGRADIGFNFVGGGPSPGRAMFWKDAKERELGGLAFELSVFGKPALDVALFVTAPVPPLEVGAGILAVLAWSPSKPDKVVVVRILSSLPGPGAIPPAAIAR